jgi:ATP-dependent protease Clp ATPase subunit
MYVVKILILEVIMSDSDNSKDIPILCLYGKDTLSTLDMESVLKNLDYSVSGNFSAKTKMVLTISQAYANKEFGSTSAVMLTGNSGVGKSSIIKSVADLTTLPLVRFDLETILEYASAGKSINNLIHSTIFNKVYDLLSPDDVLDEGEQLMYSDFVKDLPKDVDSKSILKYREKPNAEFTIIEFDNSEILVNGSEASMPLQLGLVDLIKNAILISENLSTANFVYVFSADLSKELSKKNVGFRPYDGKNITNDMLVSLGYSKKFVNLLNQVVSLNNLTASDFEHYLKKKESHLHQSILGLSKSYGVDVVVHDSTIKYVSQYLADNNKNLKSIEDITRKLLAPHYLSPKKGSAVIITPAIAKKRLNSY